MTGLSGIVSAIVGTGRTARQSRTSTKLMPRAIKRVMVPPSEVTRPHARPRRYSPSLPEQAYEVNGRSGIVARSTKVSLIPVAVQLLDPKVQAEPVEIFLATIAPIGQSVSLMPGGSGATE